MWSAPLRLEVRIMASCLKKESRLGTKFDTAPCGFNSYCIRLHNLLAFEDACIG